MKWTKVVISFLSINKNSQYKFIARIGLEVRACNYAIEKKKSKSVLTLGLESD